MYAQYIDLIEKQQIGDDALSEAVMSMGSNGSTDGEVNPGDRKAIYFVAKSFRNRSRRLTEENSRLRSQLRWAQAELRKLKGSPADDPVPAQPGSQPEDVVDAPPETVREAVERAAKHLTGIRFLETSLATARAVTQAGSFMSVSEFYRLFEVMSVCAEHRSAGGLGMGLEDWFSYRGVDYTRREGETTQARYGTARVFADEQTGKSVSMPAHFKLADSGFQLRVLVRWDDREKTWLVGHVGEHLPTVSDPH